MTKAGILCGVVEENQAKKRRRSVAKCETEEKEKEAGSVHSRGLLAKW